MANFRMLHTMLRVYDLEKSIDFYTRLLGMKLLRRTDFEGGRFTLAFVGYGDESDHTVLELTHNWHLQGAGGGRRQDPASAWPDEARHHGDRLHRGPGWLQGGADRTFVGEIRVATTSSRQNEKGASRSALFHWVTAGTG